MLYTITRVLIYIADKCIYVFLVCMKLTSNVVMDLMLHGQLYLRRYGDDLGKTFPNSVILRKSLLCLLGHV